MSKFSRFDHVVIAHFLDVAEHLVLFAVFLSQIVVCLVQLAVSLGRAHEADRFLSGQLLFVALASLVVEQALRVFVPRHHAHVQHIASQILVVPIAIGVLLRNIAQLTFVRVVTLVQLLFLVFFEVSVGLHIAIRAIPVVEQAISAFAIS